MSRAPCVDVLNARRLAILVHDAARPASGSQLEFLPTQEDRKQRVEGCDFAPIMHPNRSQ